MPYYQLEFWLHNPHKLLHSFLYTGHTCRRICEPGPLLHTCQTASNTIQSEKSRVLKSRQDQNSKSLGNHKILLHC